MANNCEWVSRFTKKFQHGERRHSVAETQQALKEWLTIDDLAAMFQVPKATVHA
jgi:hypothetical protein